MDHLLHKALRSGLLPGLQTSVCTNKSTNIKSGASEEGSKTYVLYITLSFYRTSSVPSGAYIKKMLHQGLHTRNKIQVRVGNKMSTCAFSMLEKSRNIMLHDAVVECMAPSCCHTPCSGCGCGRLTDQPLHKKRFIMPVPMNDLVHHYQ